jgi:hypothetical protein
MEAIYLCVVPIYIYTHTHTHTHAHIHTHTHIYIYGQSVYYCTTFTGTENSYQPKAVCGLTVACYMTRPSHPPYLIILTISGNEHIVKRPRLRPSLNLRDNVWATHSTKYNYLPCTKCRPVTECLNGSDGGALLCTVTIGHGLWLIPPSFLLYGDHIEIWTTYDSTTRWQS